MKVQNSVHTRGVYGRALGELFTFCGHHEPKRVTASDLARYKAALEERGCAPTTTRLYLSAIRSYFRFLVSVGRTTNDPTASLKLPKARGRRTRALSEADALRLLKAADGKACDGRTRQGRRQRAIAKRNKAILALMLGVGCRISEALTLSGENFTAQNGVLLVDLKRKGSAWSREPITLPAKTRAALEAHLGRPPWSGPLFDLKPRSAARMISRLGQRIGLPLHSHQLRATCLTLRAARGATLWQLGRLAGHADLGVTQLYVDEGQLGEADARHSFLN